MRKNIPHYTFAGIIILTFGLTACTSPVVTKEGNGNVNKSEQTQQINNLNLEDVVNYKLDEFDKNWIVSNETPELMVAARNKTNDCTIMTSNSFLSPDIIAGKGDDFLSKLQATREIPELINGKTITVNSDGAGQIQYYSGEYERVISVTDDKEDKEYGYAAFRAFDGKTFKNVLGDEALPYSKIQYSCLDENNVKLSDWEDALKKITVVAKISK